ncbi:transcription initiation factor TFIID subunit 2 [Marchantia polymorpha subsp. ruderalis]|uniref:Transcription initiation factor TFIID subunit 2 n=2 Tax=Marchantia polymorpha TaxID=3197 RepID=A0AAF6ANW6_MARPO|nr:hypothetical protein MARPO_0014s0115 [Marchantia polymorpha]BBM98136.1 hypothetical protein Mp_1g11110 [Marchantia polymorpha subsp. ruderalis]BBM98137.1 hypothetical protein Mp_1g11120 [Marchantia polymorpha subsp. ruderalis]|eukprot:PTQ45588.1 hypothetical protein MARPO_0014s0115 [Marchantia polymorpha]
MAKQRKQKQRDSRPPNAEAVSRPDESWCCTIRDQKLCVAVDIAEQRIYGYTELKVVAPKSGVIGLHARGLHIEKVLVDGNPVNFELQQVHCVNKQDRNGASIPSSPAEAADIGYPRYVATLEEEMVPELLISLLDAAGNSIDASQGQSPPEQALSDSRDNGIPQTTSETKPEASNLLTPGSANERLKLIHVQYWVEKPTAGAYFHRNVFHTNSQLRRARCWFPCVDSTSERCSYSLEFTVRSEYIAVSSGKLLYQVYRDENSSLKTYAYDLSIPTTASNISLVVAPLVVLPDRSNPMISHMCMPGDATKLQCTVSFFHFLSSTYEEYLGAPFPFGCYKQVFIDSESASSSVSIGASMVTISSHLLVDDRIIDQAFNTQVKLAHALAQQWFGVFITPDTPADAWLLEGLAGFLSDQFVKRHMGNNEARYRRYKANEAVCTVDVEGAPVLSWPSVGRTDQYGVETLGALGQIRVWKATAVVQMLEKQMGPEPFKKILQRIILRAQDPVRHMRTLSTKEFRHFANKLGNLERPFLKEFFPRWVESSGCPRLRMGFAYSKRRNMVELAVRRESTAASDLATTDTQTGSKPVTPDPGWPGMMSIRVHELDGMYDQPSLPMAGETYQLLEIQCHSKLAGRRIAKPKKGSKAEPADDSVDAAAPDMRVSMESPLLWLRADPQMEYIAEIQLHQPEQMWINQLEKDRDVVGQLQAIAAMCALPRPTFGIVTALNNCLIDSKVYCRVRIEAASALARTATEATSWTGLSNLIKFYKSRRCDPDIGLPRSNDFHDLAEYLVLEAIPGAVASVRGSDGKSPVEATDFILHILKHNDNSGNQYSDVFWLASVIEAIGSLEFGQQNLQNFSKFLKQIDRFLQYDRLMPSYNGVLTISCIHTLTRLAINFSDVLPVESLERLLQPFGDAQSSTRQVRVNALQALLELEARFRGLDASVNLALRLVKKDPSLTVQCKVMEHVINICLLKDEISTTMSGSTLAALVEQFDSSESFSNVLLRHHIFSVLQILAGRPASLYRRGDASAIPAPILQKIAPDKVQPKELKPKVTQPLKITFQPPRPEPLRIRVVPVRPNVLPKEEVPTASANSGGRESVKSGPRVGKVKLRLKPASSDAGGSPMEVSVGSHEKGAVTDLAASQSPTSVHISVKVEKSVAESPVSSYQGKRDEAVGASRVKEEVTSPQVEEGEIDPAEDDVHPIKEETFDTEDQNLGVHRMQQGSSIGSEGDANGFRETGGHDAGESSSPIRLGPKSGMSGSFKMSQNGSSKEQWDSQDIQHTTDSQPEPSGGTSTASDMKPVEVPSLTTHVEGSDGKERKDKKDKKDKKDRKHKKEKKKHHRDRDDESENQEKKRSKEEDSEYQERKRKRKEEKEQRKREKEERKVQKLDVNKTKSLHAEEKHALPSEKPAVSRVSRPEGDSSQKLRLKIKKIHSVSHDGP